MHVCPRRSASSIPEPVLEYSTPQWAHGIRYRSVYYGSFRWDSSTSAPHQCHTSNRLPTRFLTFLSLNSSTRASSGVIVAHLIPTLCFCISCGRHLYVRQKSERSHFYGMSRIDRDLIVCGISMRQTQIVVLHVHIHVRKYQLQSTGPPNRHLISVTSHPNGPFLLSFSRSLYRQHRVRMVCWRFRRGRDDLVISSPSRSTTGSVTLIFSPVANRRIVDPIIQNVLRHRNVSICVVPTRSAEDMATATLLLGNIDSPPNRRVT